MQKNKVVSKICYNTVIVFSELLATVGLDVGLPAFQLPMFAKMWRTAEKRCLFYYGIHAFVKSKPALPTRSGRSLRAAARFAS